MVSGKKESNVFAMVITQKAYNVSKVHQGQCDNYDRKEISEKWCLTKTDVLAHK